MPAKVAVVPPELLALVHGLLVDAGLSKTAKKLKSEADELPAVSGESLLEIYNKHAPAASKDKKKKDKKAKEVEEPASKKRKAADSSDEEEEEEEVVEKKAKKEKKKSSKKAKKEESEEEEEEEKEEEEVKEEATPSKKGGKKVSESPSNTPFQRVKAEEVSYLKVKGGSAEEQRLKDNTFESKNGDVYGAKASEILAAVRGKDFRHEKTKKKRGTYRGGPIDMNSNSIKFEDSDDE
eukprot:CAMPEP_0206228048 /NCGR_PEP_ID=MMETSP0047_2-20121206/8957_1 /ASSEMBLY_ACC=CAM_ASM_000192 /TAXON_ID=195065 /ORGANISM="Chroomonas mesostigmatica_cf, Strain CCMP1168" /LENGTH=236 /DNA_ID=CAMNT_0053651257 /DNA_START=49 /DNA_END=759 /DNA_ORIENTATION=+